MTFRPFDFLLMPILCMLFLMAWPVAVSASTCTQRLGMTPAFSASAQLSVLKQFAHRGCELISIRFAKTRNGAVVHSQVLWDSTAETLVRADATNRSTRFYTWLGVNRSRLLEVPEIRGFASFTFQGQTGRDGLTLRMQQHVR